MMGATSKRSAAGWTGFWVAALAALTPAISHAAAVDLFYERTVMVVADARCRLFTPQIAAALNASRAQARSASLRAGVDPSELTSVERRAQAKAGAEPCNSSAIATAASRVRTAFDGYARLMKMDYPGDHLDWIAERLVSRSGRVWNLSQTAAFGRDSVTFGITNRGGASELVAVPVFADGAQPYAARIVMRDVSRTQRAYLDHRRADATGMIPLAGRTSPRSTTRAFMAGAKFAPDPLIAPKAKGAVAYTFPAAAIAAIAELDPREAVEIEFLFAGRGGETVRRAFIEVGDFAAGRAFLAAAAR